MKIGIDARLWNESGVGRYTRNLIIELAKIDEKNQYVLFFRAKEYDSVSLPGKNFEKRLADIRWHTIKEQLIFPSILNKENLDLVHFPYFSIPIFYKKPFIVTIHDLILHNFSTGQASTLPFPVYSLKLLGYKFVIKKAVENAKKIITVSNSTKEEIINRLRVPQEKIIVTYEGIDQEIISLGSQNTRYKIPDTRYFLYVGNAYPHKNLERLIRAFLKIRNPHFAKASRGEQESEIKLILVGKEDYFYKRLKEKVHKMGLESSIVFYGYATDIELNNLYKNALALVSPSLMEGFGLPVIEAMSQQCLVLASDIPVHREIAKDAAIYFDPKNTEDIAEKMKTVHFNDMNHYSKNIHIGVERAKMFSWKKMANETLRVYENCLSIR